MDVIVTQPFHEKPTTHTSTTVVDESFHVEVFLAIDDIWQRWLADGGGVEGAGEGFEGGDMDDRVVAEVRGEVKTVGDVREGGDDAVRPIKFGAQLAVGAGGRGRVEMGGGDPSVGIDREDEVGAVAISGGGLRLLGL